MNGIVNAKNNVHKMSKPVLLRRVIKCINFLKKDF